MLLLRHKKKNEELPREIPCRGSGSSSTAVVSGSGLSAGTCSSGLSTFSRDLTSQLKENFVSFNTLNVRKLNISERLRTAEHQLDYFAVWIDPVTQTYQMAFITDMYIEEFIKTSNEYILKIQTNILDTVTEEFGASAQQVEQRKLLNRKATKIIEMLERRSP